MHSTTMKWVEQMLEAYLNGFLHSRTFPTKKPYTTASFRRTQFVGWIETIYPDIRFYDGEFDIVFQRVLDKINGY